MKTIISINGKSPPAEPMKMTISKSDLYSDSTKRSAETGTLLMYLIRRNIYTLELEYLLDTVQTKELESLIDSTKLSVKFFDGDEEKLKNMYPSDRTKEPVGTEYSRKYRLAFSLIEI